MRHSKARRKLGRTAAHRKATMSALSTALIKHHRITTTLIKAKELRRYVEPLITKAKADTTHHRRLIFAFLQDKEAVKVLFDEVAPIVGDRPGGYTRIIKIDSRRMDGADMAMIELVDYNDVSPEKGGAAKKKTRRSSGKTRNRKSAKGKAETTQSAELADEAKKEKKEAPKAADTKAKKTETAAQVKDTKSEAKTETAGETKSTTKPKAKSSTASKTSAATKSKTKSTSKSSTTAKSKTKSSSESKSKTAKKSTGKKDSDKKK